MGGHGATQFYNTIDKEKNKNFVLQKNLIELPFCVRSSLCVW